MTSMKSRIDGQYSAFSSILKRGLLGSLVCGTLSICASAAHGGPTVTRLVQKANGWYLERDGRPYRIKGAGGSGNMERLVACGANSGRTWGSDGLEEMLDKAHSLGLSIAVGIWLGHERHGFDYSNADAVAKQEEMARQAILRYRNHPAVLMWGIGNEMEGFQKGDNPLIWQSINRIAKMAKELDPNHPTMTTTTEIGGDRVGSVHRLCPDIDIMGINSYGGAPSIPERYRKKGGTKPYVVTEYGPPGTWEVAKNAFGAVHEPTSTEKAKSYAHSYKMLSDDTELCLGSYAFTWGNKQEATATWFGLLLPDGSKLGAVDALTRLWSGRDPENFCPVIEALTLEGDSVVQPSTVIAARLTAKDPDGDPMQARWVLQRDMAQYNTGGDAEVAPPTYPEAILSGGLDGAKIKTPRGGGRYRVFVYLSDGKDGAAVANLPIKIDAPERPPPAAQAKFPFKVYDEVGGSSPYAPSGWMGNTGAIGMAFDCTDNPHTGRTCLKVDYRAVDNWAGVVWLHPDGDWGDRAGGYDLFGATKLRFWARGKDGGERVKFEFGLVGRDKRFYDTGKGSLETILSPNWQQYEIDLTDKNLDRIKTGFAWMVSGHGRPITFYLDDIVYAAD